MFDTVKDCKSHDYTFSTKSTKHKPSEVHTLHVVSCVAALATLTPALVLSRALAHGVRVGEGVQVSKQAEPFAHVASFTGA